MRRRLLLNLLPRPLLIQWVQLDLALVHCPSINGTNPEGETSNMCTGDKGKQTNKQAEVAHAESHNMRSLIHSVSEYMEELWRCIRDALEKCGV